MFGILNLAKPSAVTSRDVVNHVQRLIRPIKVGHAGTLDPLATGVLVVAIGSATRLVSYVQGQPKTYRATFLLGQRSNTDDTEGVVEMLDHPPEPPLIAVQQELESLVGRIDQVPPAYSAVHIRGQRAYKLARKGESVTIAARPVEVYSIDVLSYVYPELVIEVQCGSGTYIRSIGRDLGIQLGSAAVMSALVRTAIGRFSLEGAIDPKQLNKDNLPSHLHDPIQAVPHLEQRMLDEESLTEILHGRPIADTRQKNGAEAEEVAAIAPDGRLAAILICRTAGFLTPRMVFSA